jgi:hypothetical protein
MTKRKPPEIVALGFIVRSIQKWLPLLGPAERAWLRRRLNEVELNPFANG